MTETKYVYLSSSPEYTTPFSLLSSDSRPSSNSLASCILKSTWPISDLDTASSRASFTKSLVVSQISVLNFSWSVRSSKKLKSITPFLGVRLIVSMLSLSFFLLIFLSPYSLSGIVIVLIFFG